MSVTEVGGRLQDRLRQATWAHRRFPAPPVDRPPAPVAAPAVGRSPGSWGGIALPVGLELDGGTAAAQRLLSSAEALLAGRWEVLGTVRTDMVHPDWSLDPVSGERYPDQDYAFAVDYRSPSDRRQVKQIWELSRHHHLTVLAGAWRLSGDRRFASAVDQQLRWWWDANPVLAGVNWCSGIELGIRLISWAWVRRLLEGWPGASQLFEDNQQAVRQIYWHQRFLEAFTSRGSSANNHVVAEAAGQLVASCAFPWFAESDQWRHHSLGRIEHELGRNTFPSGLDREQAFEYHGLVAELGLVAAVEAAAAGAPVRPATWSLLCRMLDTGAELLDAAGRPPRYGDGDDGRAMVVDDPSGDRWSSLLALGAVLFGPAPWWPPTATDVRSALLGGLLGRTVDVGGRSRPRRTHFADAGLTLLRSPADDRGELWCRCDGGPHGYLSIAAHGHADALSVEVRHDGIELLVDPGTYCYQGRPQWRRYFRSTLGHNTLEIDGLDQSVSGGAFLWTRQASSRVLEVTTGPGLQHWSAEHDGYQRLDDPVRHRRTVTLDPERLCLDIADQVASTGCHTLQLAFHLGPHIEARLDGHQLFLHWQRPGGRVAQGTLHLAPELDWWAHRGSTEPILGWYSPAFGHLVPTTTVVGTGQLGPVELHSRLEVRP